MKKLEIKFDLQSFLEDIAKMSPQDLGISRMLLVVETDYPEEKETNTQILLAGDSVLDASGLVYRAMEKEPKVAMAVTLAIATYISEVKGKKRSHEHTDKAGATGSRASRLGCFQEGSP